MSISWKKSLLHAVLGASILLGGGAALAADEGQQVQMLKQMFRLPEPEWRGYLTENSGMLDQSFFDRVDERIRWSAQNNQIDDAIRFALVGDFASDAVGKIGGYRYALILIFQKAGNDELARGLIDNVMLTHPDFTEVRFLRGSYRRTDGDWGGAIEDYQAALTKGYKKDECAFYLGAIHEGLGQELKAKEFYKQSNLDASKLALERLNYVEPGTPFPGISPSNATAISVDPKKFNDYFRLAEAAEKAGKLTEAEAQYQRAAAANPRDARSHLYLGAVRYRLGKLGLACTDLQRALAIDTKSAEGWRYLGCCLERRFDTSQDARFLNDAKLAYQNALKNKPGDPIAQMSLDRLNGKTPKPPTSQN